MKFSAILADPPWRFKNWSMDELAKRGEKWARACGRASYNLMDTVDIETLPVQDVAAKSCVLFLWATYPKLRDAFAVMDAWGFEYKTVAFTWVKQNPTGMGFHFGLGFWTRSNPELCLLGTRGHPKRVDNTVPNLLITPLRRHSQKPDEVHGRIERLLGDVPRLELFARKEVPGWTCLGDEIDGRDIRDSLRELASK